MASENAFFRDVGHLEIQTAQFSNHYGPNYSQNTVNHHHNNTVNDNSKHTTNYGGYNNYGQHAQGGGQINNYGPQSAKYDPLNAHRQHSSSNTPNNTAKFAIHHQGSPSSYYDGNYQSPPLGQNSPYKQPKRDYYGSSPDPIQSEPRSDNHGLARRPKSNRPTKEFDENSPEFRRQYENMTPTMKAYVQSLGLPDDSLNDGMANVTLDDPVPERSSSLGYFGRRAPDPPRTGSYSPDPPSSDEEDDVGHNEPRYGSSYIHNDNRVITKNINSHNTNTENVVDSYNDNSTLTDIQKSASAR